MSFVEICRYTCSTLSDEDFLRMRAEAIVAIKDAFPGLVDVPVLAKTADGSWTDIWIYDSEDSARYANAHADAIEVYTAWANQLSDDDIVEGHMPAGGYSPLSSAR